MMPSNLSAKKTTEVAESSTRFSRELFAKFGTDQADNVAPIISSHVLNWCGLKHAPDLLEQILRKLDVPFHYTSDPSPANGRHKGAYLRFVDTTLSLEIDKHAFRSNRGRARFSIAHEIGHIALIHTFGSEVISWSEESAEAYEQVETVCDQVASHILMPRALLRTHFRQHGIHTLGIHAALKKFGVSKQALLTGLADIQPNLAAFNLQKFARHDRELSEWRIANCGASSSSGTSAPWLAVGSTIKKHLLMDIDLDVLKADDIWSGSCLWKMGKKSKNFRAVVCKMGAVDSRAVDQFVMEDVGDYGRIKQDVFRGAIAVVGPADRMDTTYFAKR